MEVFLPIITTRDKDRSLPFSSSSEASEFFDKDTEAPGVKMSVRFYPSML